MNYYLKILSGNELGYRKGVCKGGATFYVSKQAKDFFPPLSKSINNHCLIINFYFPELQVKTDLKYIYHNDKYNRIDGTRDEYRLYLNRDICPHDYYFKPLDIIRIENKSDQYILEHFPVGHPDYEYLKELISDSKIRGNHCLC